MMLLLLLLLLSLEQNRIISLFHPYRCSQVCFDRSSRHSNWMSVGVNTFYFKTVQLIQHFTHYVLKNTVSVLSERDFRHLPWCPEDLRCSGLFCTIAWLVTDPLGWSIGPTFNGEDVHHYRTNLRWAATQKREDRKVLETVSSLFCS